MWTGHMRMTSKVSVVSYLADKNQSFFDKAMTILLCPY